MTLAALHANKPLSSTAKFALIGSATLAIALFYFFAVTSALLLLVILAIELATFVALLRFGASRVIVPFLRRHSAVFVLCVSCFRIRLRNPFQVPLEEADAPALFAFLQNLSERLHVPAPRRVLIEMNASAWVLLKGLRQGADATTLGIGYDLLAALTEREVEAVLAHEMTHAKLVRRGLKQWLNGGLSRAANLANGLASLLDTHRRANHNFEVGEWLLSGADRCARLACRSVAAYSRQDEFEADLGAAEICGSAPLRSSLIKLENLALKTARIRWNERVARLQRGEGFSSWLTEELSVTDSGLDVPTFKTATDAYSSHPSLRDRLAALPPDHSPDRQSRPAIGLFANPDSVASRLVKEIHRTAQIEEVRDSRERQRWLRRTRRDASVRPLQWLGILVVAIGLIIGVFSWVEISFNVIPLLFGLVITAGGLWLYRFFRYRDRHLLPVPTFEHLKAAWSQPRDQKTMGTQESALTSEIKQSVDRQLKKNQTTYLINESYVALGKCDYLRAHVAARQCIQLNKKSVEGFLALAIASAAFHNQTQTVNMLRAVIQLTGLRSRSTLWGAGWALLLLGDWASCEAILAELKNAYANEPTFAALLAFAQISRNKLQGGIENAKLALAALPASKDRIMLLAEPLLGSGCLNEAGKLLAGAKTSPRDVELDVVMIRLHLLQRDFTAADKLIECVRQEGMTAQASVMLGVACETARRDELAAEFYTSGLARGYFPEAHLGLARLAFHRRDKTLARKHVLASLNTQCELGENARSPLSMFTQALGQLLQLEELLSNAKAQIATFTGNAIAGPLAKQSFMIFAESEKHAVEYMKAVADGILPDKPSLLPTYVQWKEATKDQQPIGAVRPGIQRFWRT